MALKNVRTKPHSCLNFVLIFKYFKLTFVFSNYHLYSYAS